MSTSNIVLFVAEGGLDEPSNVQKMQIAGSDKPVAFYNLDIWKSHVGEWANHDPDERLPQHHWLMIKVPEALERKF